MRKMKENNVRERIINILKEHSEGLTILDISDISGVSRITVSKYIYWFMIENLIYQRRIGTAKLCYLRMKEWN